METAPNREALVSVSSAPERGSGTKTVDLNNKTTANKWRSIVRPLRCAFLFAEHSFAATFESRRPGPGGIAFEMLFLTELDRWGHDTLLPRRSLNEVEV